MTSRHIPNPYEDYKKEKNTFTNSDATDISDEFRKKLSAGTEQLMQLLKHNEHNWHSYEDSSLYTGLPGIAYTLYHYGKTSKDETYVINAEDYVNKIVTNLRGKRHVTFLTGNAGPLSLSAVMNHLSNNVKKSKDSIEKLKSLSSYVLDEGSGIPDELLYGRVGYLYSLLFVNKHISPTPIEENLIKQVISCILNSGKKYASARGFKSSLMYAWHDSEYLGGAHGLAGIIYILLQAKDYLTENQLNNEIEPALQWLESLKYPSGNFPSSVGSTTDKLVHWCHGAPSMTMLFCLSYEIFKKDQYLQTALQCGEVVWSRGLLKKGCGICHGVAGNAYTFISLFQITKDPKYLYRSCQFANWCINYNENQKKEADRPFSLFEGLAGTIYFLVDMQKIHEAKFPGYTL